MLQFNAFSFLIVFVWDHSKDMTIYMLCLFPFLAFTESEALSSSISFLDSFDIEFN